MINFQKYSFKSIALYVGVFLILFFVVFVAQKTFSNKGINIAQVISTDKYSEEVGKSIFKDNGQVSGILYQEEEELFEKDKITTANKASYLITDDYRKIYISSDIKNIENYIGQNVVYDPSKKEIVEAKNNSSVKSGGLDGRRNGAALVFLVRFENSLQNPGSASEIRSKLFPTAPQVFDTLSFSLSSAYVDRFFKQTSQNKVKYNGKVYGWYEVPGPGSSYTSPDTGGVCYVSDSMIQDMVEYYDVNTSRYNTIITITNCADYNNIGGVYNGYYSVLGNGQPYWTVRMVAGHNNFYPAANGYTIVPGYASVITHELGHSFDLYHSNALDCNTVTIGQVCGHVEYGNPFDRMGLPDHMGILNFTQQKKAGWIDEDNILQITSPGTYHIDDIQKQDGVVGAEIFIPGLGLENPVFYLEHRKPIRFNSWLANPIYNDVVNGLLLYAKTGHTSPNGGGSMTWWQPPSWYNFPRIVDPNPTGESIIYDIWFDSIHDTFSDPNFGITIDVTSVDVDGINFDVNYSVPSECPPNEPIQEVLSNYRVGYPGANGLVFQDILGPVFVPTYVATGTVDILDFVIDHENVNEYPICPVKNYSVIPADQFTDSVIGGEQYFSVLPQTPPATAATISLDPLTNQPAGEYNINFNIRDQATLEEQPVNINIIKTP